MKKLLFLLPLVFITVGCNKEYKDLKFNLKIDDTYSVSLKDDVKSKKISVPKKYHGKTVSEIDNFKINDYVEEIEIPKTIETIEYDAFSFCSKLEKIDVSIGNDFFKSKDGCLYSKDNILLTYPSGKNDIDYTIDAKEISRYAFTNTSFLKNITLNVEKVDEYAFYECAGINTLTIGKNVSSIEDDSFRLSGLTSIKVDSENNNFTINDFMLLSKDKKVLYLYPAGRDSETIRVDAKTITSHAFNNADFKRLVVGKDVEEVKEDAFYCCNSFKEIVVDSQHVMDEFINIIDFKRVKKVYLNSNINISEEFNELFVEGTSDIPGYKLFEVR